ncbi:MAG: amino acid-binding protein [Chloroflexi bacterium]|nr:amino acid-binding protein [Chloroflexota bacterium]
MRVTQVSAFLENRPGRLLYLLNVLAEHGINLIAHNIVDASDFGIVHLIVDDPQKALRVIRDQNITASTTTVLQVQVPDEPGAFVRRVLQPLADAKINIEYSYAYSAPETGKATIVLKVDNLEAAEKALSDLG